METETWSYWAQWLQSSTFYTREVFTWPVLFSQIGKGYLNPVMAAVTTVGFRKESLPNPCLPGRAGSEGPVTIEKLLVLGKGVILGNPLWFVHWFFFPEISLKIWTYQLHLHKVHCPGTQSKIKADEALP